MTKSPTHRPHDQAVVELLQADPLLAQVYLDVATQEGSEPGGQAALLAAQRQVAQARQLPAKPPPAADGPL